MLLCHKCQGEIGGETQHGLHPKCFAEWFSCEPKEQIDDLIPAEQSSSNVIPRRVQSFLHGKFRKYTGMIGQSSYVFKVIEKDYPNLPRVEFVCNQIASAIGLRIPPYYFLQLEGQDCFVSRNFVEGTRWRKLTHIYHYLDSEREFDVEAIGEAIFRVTGKPQDLDQFHYTILFDALVGNHDRHGRNLGIISQGKMNRLAPTYDNPSYIGIESLLEANLSPRGKIFTAESQEPTMKDYVIELKRLDRQKTLNRFQTRCSLEKILAIVGNSFLNPKVTSAMARLIQKRHEEFNQNF